ncbi:---NA--- [Octopus vulgaris]|uniref:---NA n=1 Tax=Octopus vulgaris TaxID=6645 RepID=A0AA36BY70_OCTVU|nr:---NA--- [Octopus vulgaris]
MSTKSFSDHRTLTSHKRIQTKVKPFHWELNTENLPPGNPTYGSVKNHFPNFPGHLTEHKRIHTREKPYL